jgi:hypothetical protein
MSPYLNLPQHKWEDKTRKLIAAHPLAEKELVEVVLESWKSIFKSTIGRHAKIGVHIFPKPQMIGLFLHELIAMEIEARYPDKWRRDDKDDEKDLVCVPNPRFSIEIKTSSHPSGIFANRSYAQAPTDRKKSKSGYYLAVNFQPVKRDVPNPEVRRIRFGWLDHSDWIGQSAPTGQQAHLNPNTRKAKLLPLYP